MYNAMKRISCLIHKETYNAALRIIFRFHIWLVFYTVKTLLGQFVPRGCRVLNKCYLLTPQFKDW